MKDSMYFKKMNWLNEFCSWDIKFLLKVNKQFRTFQKIELLCDEGFFFFHFVPNQSINISTPFSVFVPLNRQCQTKEIGYHTKKLKELLTQLPLSPQDIDSPQLHDKKKLLDVLTLLIQNFHHRDQEKNQSTSKW